MVSHFGPCSWSQTQQAARNRSRRVFRARIIATSARIQRRCHLPNCSTRALVSCPRRARKRTAAGFLPATSFTNIAALCASTISRENSIIASTYQCDEYPCESAKAMPAEFFLPWGGGCRQRTPGLGQRRLVRREAAKRRNEKDRCRQVGQSHGYILPCGMSTCRKKEKKRTNVSRAISLEEIVFGGRSAVRTRYIQANRLPLHANRLEPGSLRSAQPLPQRPGKAVHPCPPRCANAPGAR